MHVRLESLAHNLHTKIKLKLKHVGYEHYQLFKYIPRKIYFLMLILLGNYFLHKGKCMKTKPYLKETFFLPLEYIK